MKKMILFAVVLPLITTTICAQNLTQRKLEMTLYAINNLYVDKVDNDKLVEDAIIALLDKLDPHSNYMNKEEVKELNEPLQGNFDGIGIQFNMLTDTLYVAQVIAGGPSQKVGLLPGDRIIRVNDTLIAGVKMKNTDIMKRLRGPKGTTVMVKVLRYGVPELIEFKIVRDKIPIYSVDAYYMIDKETGYITISRFAVTTHDEFIKAFSDLKAQGMKNLILDLQGNGGGYLTAAIQLADEFLDDKKLIVYTEGLHQKREDALAEDKGVFETGKLIILINETSASASEIVSGAIQDWDRGVIVGRRSFGKGLVQRPIPLPDGTMLRLTTARYYTPSGRSIQKPYENGNIESYNNDLIERFNHGEMLSADSIHFPDSLKYNTLINKRTVYGGGGIMPDYFVPLDTTSYTAWHRNVNAKGIPYRITMGYVDKNKESIKSQYKNFDSYYTGYNIPDGLMRDLKNAALHDSIKFNEEQYAKSENLLKLQLKALIAQSVYEKSEYFTRVINDSNETLKKAIDIINDPKSYQKLLGGKK